MLLLDVEVDHPATIARKPVHLLPDGVDLAADLADLGIEILDHRLLGLGGHDRGLLVQGLLELPGEKPELVVLLLGLGLAVEDIEGTHRLEPVLLEHLARAHRRRREHPLTRRPP